MGNGTEADRLWDDVKDRHGQRAAVYGGCGDRAVPAC